MKHKEAKGTPYEPFSHKVAVHRVREDLPECLLMGIAEAQLTAEVRLRQKQRLGYHVNSTEAKLTIEVK